LNPNAIYDQDLAGVESLAVEFKREFPETARDISKVIASFASTSGGRIYFGVENDGKIAGLDPKLDRDAFQLRILGVCGGIDPRIRVFVNFIERNEKTICVVNVPKGTEPAYFVDGIPYLRDLSESRRATATEVKEAHLAHFVAMGVIEREDEDQSFAIELLYQLSDIILIASDYKDHLIGPDSNQLLYDLGTTGSTLLELSSEATAKKFGAEAELRRMADALSDLARFIFTMGSVDRFGQDLKQVAEMARRLENRITKRIDDVDLDDIRSFLTSDLNELKREWEKASSYLRRGEFERLLDTFRRLAFSFNRIGHLPEPSHAGGITLRLRELAEKLRGVTSYEKYYISKVTDPISLLKKPMNEILEIANEIERVVASQ
jgi:hypothetical protein